MNYTIYFLSNGEIYSAGNTVDAPVVDVDKGWIEGAYDGAEYYVDVAASPIAVQARQANPSTIDKETVTADGVDSVTVSNVPAGSTVKVSGDTGAEVEVNDGEVSVTFEDAGRYRITVKSFPLVPVQFQITATA